MEIKILTVLFVGACASSMTEAFSSPDRGGYQFIPGQVRSSPPSRNRYQFIPGRTSQNNRPLIGADIASLPPKDRPHSIRGRDIASLPPKDRPLIGGDIASLPPKDRPLIGGDIASLPPKDRPHSIRGRNIASLPPKDRPLIGGDIASLPPKDRPLIGGDIASLPPKDRPKFVGPGGIRPMRLGQGDEFSSEESAESHPSFIGGATARPSNKRGGNGGQGVRSSHY